VLRAVDLKRQDIERTDFASVRRGYDSAEVDQHLRAVADSLDQAVKEASRDSTAAGAASRGVKQILEAAEKLASDLETQSRKEGERIETAARLEGEKIVEKAQQAAAAEEKRAQRAGERLKRANSELTRLREALAGLQPVTADEPIDEPDEEPRAAKQPKREQETKEQKAATAHAEPTNGDGAAEQAQESPAEAAHEAAPDDKAPAAAEDGEGARLIALNMALTGTPREETARYLQENFELEDPESILDDAYSRAG
jgi:DivIVA domain-containing protein